MIGLLLLLASAASVKGADLQLLEAVREVAGRVEELRGQSFERPPVAVRAPRSILDVAGEIRAYNILTRERLAARGRAWADLGLGETETPAALFLALARDLGGICYEPTGNRLLVAPDRLPVADFVPGPAAEGSTAILMMTGVHMDEPLVSHLLMHVRQHERRGGDWLAPTTDQLLARSAWAEGEANLLAVRHLFAGMGLADDVLQLQLDPRDILEGRLFPSDLDQLTGIEGELVRFVYLDGFDHAARHYRAGGWAALDEAMQRVDTTRGLLHPGAAPIREGRLPTPPAPALEGARLVDEDSLGEQAIVVLLSFWTGKDDLALQGGDGWTYDRVYRWETGSAEEGRGLTQWFSRWSSAEEASDFEYALVRALRARFPRSESRKTAPGVWVLTAPERIFRIERDGSEIQLRVIPPDLDRKLTLLETGGTD